jgi:hypothetical protein
MAIIVIMAYGNCGYYGNYGYVAGNYNSPTRIGEK